MLQVAHDVKQEKGESKSREYDDADAPYTHTLDTKTAPLYLIPLIEVLSSELRGLKVSDYSKSELGQFFGSLQSLASCFGTVLHIVRLLPPSVGLMATLLKEGKTMLDAISKLQGAHTLAESRTLEYRSRQTSAHSVRYCCCCYCAALFRRRV